MNNKVNEAYVIIEEKDLEKIHRTIDFENEEIQKKYEKLNEEDKKIILDLIRTLYKKEDNLGYNLKCLKEFYKEIYKDYKSKGTNMNQYSISKHMEKYMDENSISETINKVIKRGISHEGTVQEDILNVFCKYYLIEPELLKNGHGIIYTISDEALELIKKNKKAVQDINKENEEVIKNLIKKDKKESEKNYPTLKYLIERLEGKIGKKLLTKEYAVMLKDGRYIGLKKDEKEIINRLIESLS